MRYKLHAGRNYHDYVKKLNRSIAEPTTGITYVDPVKNLGRVERRSGNRYRIPNFHIVENRRRLRATGSGIGRHDRSLKTSEKSKRNCKVHRCTVSCHRYGLSKGRSDWGSFPYIFIPLRSEDNVQPVCKYCLGRRSHLPYEGTRYQI